jgi:hypothetical protein
MGSPNAADEQTVFGAFLRKRTGCEKEQAPFVPAL